MTTNLTEKLKNAHPLHSALLGGGVYALTNNAMFGAGVGLVSYAYMANFGHGFGPLGNVGTETDNKTKPVMEAPKVTPVHDYTPNFAYNKNDYATHIAFTYGAKE